MPDHQYAFPRVVEHDRAARHVPGQTRSRKRIDRPVEQRERVGHRPFLERVATQVLQQEPPRDGAPVVCDGGHSGTTAVASISTSASGSISAATTTTDMAG